MEEFVCLLGCFLLCGQVFGGVGGYGFVGAGVPGGQFVGDAVCLGHLDVTFFVSGFGVGKVGAGFGEAGDEVVVVAVDDSCAGVEGVGFVGAPAVPARGGDGYRFVVALVGGEGGGNVEQFLVGALNGGDELVEVCQVFGYEGAVVLFAFGVDGALCFVGFGNVCKCGLRRCSGAGSSYHRPCS